MPPYANFAIYAHNLVYFDTEPDSSPHTTAGSYQVSNKYQARDIHIYWQNIQPHMHNGSDFHLEFAVYENDRLRYEFEMQIPQSKAMSRDFCRNRNLFIFPLYSSCTKIRMQSSQITDCLTRARTACDYKVNSFASFQISRLASDLDRVADNLSLSSKFIPLYVTGATFAQQRSRPQVRYSQACR